MHQARIVQPHVQHFAFTCQLHELRAQFRCMHLGIEQARNTEVQKSAYVPGPGWTLAAQGNHDAQIRSLLAHRVAKRHRAVGIVTNIDNNN